MTHPISPQTPIPANVIFLAYHAGDKRWISQGPFAEETKTSWHSLLTHWQHQPPAPERTLTDAEHSACTKAFAVHAKLTGYEIADTTDFEAGFLAALKYNESLSK